MRARAAAIATGRRRPPLTRPRESVQSRIRVGTRAGGMPIGVVLTLDVAGAIAWGGAEPDRPPRAAARFEDDARERARHVVVTGRERAEAEAERILADAAAAAEAHGAAIVHEAERAAEAIRARARERDRARAARPQAPLMAHERRLRREAAAAWTEAVREAERRLMGVEPRT
jgi:hypothetical protein